MVPIQWTSNHGRNGWDASLDVGDGACVDCRNIHYYHGGLGTKRGGSVSIGISGATGPLNAAVEYVPGQDPAAAELFLVDNSATTKILRGNAGTNATTLTLTNLTLTDNVATTPIEFSAVTLNGKLYCAYDSTVNRLHVFDPGLSTTTVRRAGMVTPAAPTGADDGAGALSLTRSYKVAYTEQRSGVTVRRSELSPVLTRTIVNTLGSTITKPAASSPAEGETHWELYASDTVTGTYYLIATTAVGTATYDDTAATVPTTTAQALTGANTPFPSVKYLGTDGNRLVGFGAWETSAGDSLAPKNGRVYFGPVLDSSSVHDDERINNSTSLQGWIDTGRNSGAVDRGLTKKPVNNVFYAFQSDRHFALYPTENPTTPYRRVVFSGVGAVNNQSIVIATLKDGSEAAFFLDPVRGAYTVGGQYGLKWCGKDVKDLWDTVNLDASTLVACGAWYPDRNLIVWAVATGSATEPDLILTLDISELRLDEEGDLRGGWAPWDGDFAAVRSLVMFSNTVATTRSRKRVPYAGLTAGTFLRYSEAATDDAGTAFQAYATSGTLAHATEAMELQRAYLRAATGTGTSIQQTLVRNFGDETGRTATAVLTGTGSQTAILKKFEDAALQDGDALQVTLGDASAVASAWTLHRWTADIRVGAAF